MNTWILLKDNHYEPVRLIEKKTEKIEIIYDEKENNTDKYDKRIAIIRRGTYFLIKHTKLGANKIQYKDISILLQTRERNSIAEVELSASSPKDEGFELSIHETHETSITVKITVGVDCAIGLYSVFWVNIHEKFALKNAIYVVFNPFHHKDVVFTPDTQLLSQHLIEEGIKIYAGSFHRHTPIKYLLDQFTLESIFVCAYFLEKMNIQDRTSPILVSRGFSALVNANDDNGLLLGNWEEVKDGTPSTQWTRALEIYSRYLLTGSSVKWGQCFVFAMMLTSMCRNVGIVCRAVSGFDIAHDNDHNGIIEIFTDSQTLETLRGSEMIWNFHSWNNIILKRNDIILTDGALSHDIHGWQHLDGTPQERSKGIYRCGPFPIKLIRQKMIDKKIPFDGLPVYYSINYISKEILVGKGGRVIKESMNHQSTNLIVTTDTQGRKLNILSEYKDERRIEEIIETSGLFLDVVVPESAICNQAMEYKITVKNAKKNILKKVTLTVDLKNSAGKNLIESHIYTSNQSFLEDTYHFTGKTTPWKVNRTIDLSLCSFVWSLKYIDTSTNQLANVEKLTALMPCFSGDFELPTHKIALGKFKFNFRIKNLLHVDVSAISITFYRDGFYRESATQVEVISAFGETLVQGSVMIKEYGIVKVSAKIFSPYFNGTIAKSRIVAEK